jgi:hypothetical protein
VRAFRVCLPSGEGYWSVVDDDLRLVVEADARTSSTVAIKVTLAESLRCTDTRGRQACTLTTLNVRLLADGHLAAKAYGRPTGGGRGTYVSSPSPTNPNSRPGDRSRQPRGTQWARPPRAPAEPDPTAAARASGTPRQPGRAPRSPRPGSRPIASARRQIRISRL